MTISGWSTRERRFLAQRLLACFCAAAAWAAVATSHATAAANYVVTGVCSVAGLEGMFAMGAGDGIRAVHGCIDGQSKQFGVAADLAQATISGGEGWMLVAPHFTTIHSIEIDRRFIAWGDQFRWEIAKTNFPFGGGATTLETVTGATAPANGPVTFPVDAKAVTVSLSCDQETCDGTVPRSQLADVLFKFPSVVLTDEAAPGRVTGSLLGGGSADGVVDVTYSAVDGASGVASVGLIVDGLALPVLSESNEGKCQKPYQFLVPCKAQVEGALPLDTGDLSNGDHLISVVATDAAGQETESAPFTVTVHNSPISTERPLLSGLARIGERLTSTSGRWSGEPSAFAFQWLRCPSDARLGDERGCTAISGATQPQYTVVAADIGHRDVARVTAENAFGEESALSNPSDLVGTPGSDPPRRPGDELRDTTPPILKAKLHRGTILRFSSSEAGTLSVAIVRVRARWGMARKPIATFTRAIDAGRGRVALGGRIGRKRLIPGRYRLRVSTTDLAGNNSNVVRRSFRVQTG